MHLTALCMAPSKLEIHSTASVSLLTRKRCFSFSATTLMDEGLPVSADASETSVHLFRFSTPRGLDAAVTPGARNRKRKPSFRTNLQGEAQLLPAHRLPSVP